MLNKKSILGRRQHLCEIVVFWTVVICGFMCKPFPYLEKLQNQYFHHSTPHGSPLSFLHGRILGNCSTQCRPGRMMPCSNLFASRSNRSAWPLAPSTATPLGLGIFVPIPEFTNTTSKRLQSDTTVLPPPHLVQAASWWEGDKHFLHLRTLLMALTHSAPGANFATGSKRWRPAGTDSWPQLILSFPLSFASSIFASRASLLTFASILPIGSELFQVGCQASFLGGPLISVGLVSPSPTSASGGSASWRPGTWALTAAPAATTKEGHSNSHPSRLSGRNSCHASWAWTLHMFPPSIPKHSLLTCSVFHAETTQKNATSISQTVFPFRKCGRHHAFKKRSCPEGKKQPSRYPNSIHTHKPLDTRKPPGSPRQLFRGLEGYWFKGILKMFQRSF